ncbi:MAG: ABC transporter ATP-binding protein/permease [Pirellulales bacterium]|nr:ABC transporter ATP-binding protein/permease [Pirellulales bacterium]
MGNFGRALRLALTHRGVCVASLVCALLVGVLWGGNIAAVYPFVEVAFKGRSLQDWLHEEIAKVRGEEAAAAAVVARLDGEIAAATDDATRARLTGERRDSDYERRAAQESLHWYELVQPTIDAWLPSTPFATLAVITLFLLVGTLVKSAFFILHSVLVSRMTQSAIHALRKEFFRRSLRMDLASFHVDGSSELMSRFTYDMESLAGGMRELLGKAVREPLKMLACLAGAAFICWRLLLLSLVIAPVAALLINRLGKMLKRANRKAMEEMSQLYGLLEETFQGIKVVKAFTMERYERRRFFANSKQYYFKSMKIARYDALTRPLTEVMGIATICLALLAGAYLVLNQETHLMGIRMSSRPLSLSSLLVFYALLAGVSDPFRKLSEVFGRITRASAAADRIYAMLDREPSVRDSSTPVALPRHNRDLTFDAVSFAYQPGVPVLSEIHLQIAAGETVAIVGPNGCGKSTLVNLVPRFFDPVSGVVRLDGVDLRDVRQRDLRRQIGLVTQETLLFDDTVYNNIRYGSPRATREEIIAAAEQAHAHRFIVDKLERGYETMVGSHGSMLSGGQRQRIALARAILRDPALLILDEATSQIDLESEQLIHQVLEQFTRGRTTLIITHRLSTLALADRIVVMDGGRIEVTGTHQELLHRSPLYARLHELQFRKIA